MEQIRQSELMNAGKFSIRRGVGSSNNALFGCYALSVFPKWRDCNLVNTITPRIKGNVLWLVQTVFALQAKEFTAGKFAHFVQGRLDFC
jgi:hypothetical protein